MLSGGCASASESNARGESSDFVFVRPGVHVPKLSLPAPCRSTPQTTMSIESVTDDWIADIASSVITPRYQPEYVSKLEATNLDLRHKVLALETELHRAWRQEKQQNFVEESMLMDILGSSAELQHTMKRMEKLAKAGATLGVMPTDDLMLAKLSKERQTDTTAEVQKSQLLPAQERARYENEIAELREISEAMLKELARRIEGVERAEEEAFTWQQRTEALQRRLADSDQEYKRLEGRLTDGLARLRKQHQQEIAHLTEENALLRKAINKACDESEATKRQQQIMRECLEEVTSSFRAIGGQDLEYLQQDLNAGPVVVHKALLSANVEDAKSIASCLDGLMARACILQRHFDIVSGDLNAARQTKNRYFDTLQDTNAALLSIVGLSADDSRYSPFDKETRSFDNVVTSIDACLANVRANAHKIWYTVDEAEHQVASLEESFGALTTMTKVRAMTHNGLLERISVISGQQHELTSLKTKTLSAENERLQSLIDISQAKICNLENDLDMLTAEKMELEGAAESCRIELSKAQLLGEERQHYIKRLELEAKELAIAKEDLTAGEKTIVGFHVFFLSHETN